MFDPMEPHCDADSFCTQHLKPQAAFCAEDRTGIWGRQPAAVARLSSNCSIAKAQGGFCCVFEVKSLGIRYGVGLQVILSAA